MVNEPVTGDRPEVVVFLVHLVKMIDFGQFVLLDIVHLQAIVTSDQERLQRARPGDIECRECFDIDHVDFFAVQIEQTQRTGTSTTDENVFVRRRQR